MTPYRFRLVSAVALLVLLAFMVMAFGAVDQWALTIFEVGVFLLAIAWAFRLALGKARPVWNPFYLPLGLVTAWTGLQYALGLTVYRYRTAAEALKWLAFWLLFVVAAHVFVDQSIRRMFGRAMVWFIFALCVFGLIQNFTSAGLLYWSIAVPTGRIFGPFVNANHFAALLELVTPTAALLVLRADDKRMIYVGVLLILLGAAVVGGSRAGIVLVGLETVVVLCVKGWRSRQPKAAQKRRRLVLAASSLAVVAVLVALVSRSQPVAGRFGEEQPYQVRWTVVQATWKLFLSRPWTGYGAGTFDQVYPSANPIDVGLFWPHAHNDPVQFAMEWGVIGPVSLAWILGLLFRRRWAVDQWLRAVLPVMAVLVHSWVDFPFQIPAVAAAWLLTLALLPPPVKVEAVAAPHLAAARSEA